nr:hypothetical protein [uncultured Mediterranean phage uvMED]
MKVPTYEAQSARPRQGSGQFLTAQLSASAMTAPGRAYAEQGQNIASKGEQLREFAFKKAQISADSEAKEKALQLEVELAQAEIDASKDSNPQRAEQTYLNKARTLTNKFQSGLSNSLTRSAFNSQAGRINAQSRVRFMKANNARVVEIKKTLLTDNTNDMVKAATDLSQSPASRELSRDRGILYITDAAKDLGPAEVANRLALYHEDLVQNTLAQHINKPGQDVLQVVKSFREGTLNDSVLQAAAKELTPEKLNSIAKAATTQANAIIKMRVNMREEKEAQESVANDKTYNSIVNVDTSNAAALKQARDNHARLKSAGYYAKPAHRKAVDDLLEDPKAATGGTFPKASDETAKVEAELTEKESTNTLSYEELIKNKTKVTEQFYKSMLNTLETERSEAERDAIADFSDTFRYTEAADAKLMGTPSRQAYMKARKEIRRFIREKPKASYKDVMDKSAEIIKSQKQDFMAKFERYKRTSLTAAYSLLTENMRGRIPNPATATVEELSRAVATEMARNPGAPNLTLNAFNNALNKAIDLRIFD